MNQNQKALIFSPALQGAFYMMLAGIAFAGLNIATQWVTMVLQLPSSATAFWQYFFALLFSLPLLFKLGLSAMKTSHPLWHLLRVVLAALGVQTWVLGLAHVPIWQAIALVMTSPFFIIVGAHLFLGEKIGTERWLASAVGFTGAMIILRPWSDSFTLYALLPIISAVLWGASSLVMKRLLAFERSETVTVWLLALLTPINGALATVTGFSMPDMAAMLWLAGSGALMVLAQFWLAKAYASADAAYVQPFDDLKLPLNVLAGFLVFGYAPVGSLWIGAIMILAASLFIMTVEHRREQSIAS